MSGLFQKTLLSTSAVGISLLATAPAFGAGLTGATLNGGSYLLYEQQGTSTVLNNNADLATLLQGDINAPGGNIELSGMLGNANAADEDNATTLSGFLNGQQISVSSLTRSDWLYTTYQGYNSFAEKWFSEAWNHSDTGLQSWFASQGATTYNSAFSAFLFGGGFARFSDPNVNYVNQNSNGDISIGLAGHLNHDSGLKLSEVVKVNYGGETHFLYGFGDALASGLVNSTEDDKYGDDVSHTGLYNLTIPGEPTTDIPEPSTMLGLLAIGGLFGLTKRNKSNA
ncbi:MAG: NF038130 family PEP-CTERM protein [Cyanobacteriota bacterium]